MKLSRVAGIFPNIREGTALHFSKSQLRLYICHLETRSGHHNFHFPCLVGGSSEAGTVLPRPLAGCWRLWWVQGNPFVSPKWRNSSDHVNHVVAFPLPAFQGPSGWCNMTPQFENHWIPKAGYWKAHLLSHHPVCPLRTTGLSFALLPSTVRNVMGVQERASFPSRAWFVLCSKSRLGLVNRMLYVQHNIYAPLAPSDSL